MTEVRSLSNNIVATESHTYQPHNQYGLFATKSYQEGDVILVESPLVIFSASSPGAGVPAAISSVAATTTTTTERSECAPCCCRSQFAPSFLTNTEPFSSSSSLTINDLILPPTAISKLSKSNNEPKNAILEECRANKLRGMILALSAYATNPPSGEANDKLLELYHPSISSNSTEKQDNAEEDAVRLAKLALSCGRVMAAPDSALRMLLKNKNYDELDMDDDDDDDDDRRMMKILLVYSCNAFEGGRLYHRLSRVNHSCNPNAVVLEHGGGNSSSSGNDDDDDNDTEAKHDASVLKAACDIAPGEEITISYLGKYLFAGYPIRQRILRANKHFECSCSRCSILDTADCEKYAGKRNGEGDTIIVDRGDDVASCIPCPKCHLRSGRYLDEDVMLDEDADEEDGRGFKVCYATPRNGLTPAERSVYCRSCKGTTKVILDDAGSLRKKKEGTAIKYMCMAEDKVYERLESIGKANGGGDTESEQEMDRQFLQMATSICGSRHWTTHFMNLHLMEESLASIHSTMMSNATKDAEMMEDIYVELAEAADGLDKAYKFASSLGLKLHPAHWLFDYTIALAQTLVGLGDEKSQKYGSTWIERLGGYAEQFENEGMRKVVITLRDAWKRGECGSADKRSSEENREETEDSKRRKMG